MDKLTEKQEDVLNYMLTCHFDERYWPTLEEISSAFGWASVTAARQHVEALIKKGFVERLPGMARYKILKESGQ